MSRSRDRRRGGGVSSRRLDEEGMRDRGRTPEGGEDERGRADLYGGGEDLRGGDDRLGGEGLRRSLFPQPSDARFRDLFTKGRARYASSQPGSSGC